MSTILVLAAVFATVLTAFVLVVFIRSRLAHAREAREKEKAARARAAGTVQCFSCGLVVPRDKALEKKGRFFCGVKRNDRNGNPVERKSPRR